MQVQDISLICCSINDNLPVRTSSESDKLRCRSCGGCVTEETCADCGSYFPWEEQARLQLECLQVLAAVSPTSDCGLVLGLLPSLSPLLAEGHQLLLQASHAVLQHLETCRSCSNSRQAEAALSQISRLRKAILATSLDLPAFYR